MSIVLTLLLIVHGLIHLLGFVKAFDLAKVPQLTGATLFHLPPSFDKGVGLLWLLASLLFLTAAAARLLESPAFWPVALAAVLLSQVLVLYAWPDAKAGTLPNVILAFAVLFSAADARFQAATDQQVDALFSQVPVSAGAVVTEQQVAALPPPVRAWLQRSGVVNRPRPQAVFVRQTGSLRTAPDGGSMPALAEQYFTTDAPAFLWRVRVTMAGFLPIAGRDTFVDGQGQMLIQALSLVPVAHANDEKTAQGSLQRYLAETVWFPSGALSPYIRWEAVNETSARATMSYRGVEGSCVFHFDSEGRFQELTAMRYMGSGAEAKLQPWVIPASAFRVMDGVEIPVKGEVIWRLAEGDFVFYSWEVTEVRYNVPGRIPAP